ncbi:SCP2 sterol-binding domain-containing protein [Lipomyces japonicus]|uniref:SCP2 sterol-binding domain-containing protein n=1 Tax=Lipomyces japonicus TaxID=56871 RepID=UPI0034CF3017
MVFFFNILLDSFPSSNAFDLIKAGFADENARKKAIRQAKAIFAFTLTNSSNQTESWFIDLKSSGDVGKGLAPEGKKADVTLALSDDNFQKLIDGKINAQKLFMSGKLKIKGDIMKASSAENIFKAIGPAKAKL